MTEVTDRSLTVRYTDPDGRETKVNIDGAFSEHTVEIVDLVKIFAKRSPRFSQVVDYTNLNGMAGQFTANSINSVTPVNDDVQKSIVTHSNDQVIACRETASVLIQRWERAKSRSWSRS